jgi:hypothetical protein
MNDAPSRNAGAGAEVDHVVCGADRLFVVFDDDDGVPDVAHSRECFQQSSVVALVQADRGFVEDVDHTRQLRPHLARQSDALRFSTRQ